MYVCLCVHNEMLALTQIMLIRTTLFAEKLVSNIPTHDALVSQVCWVISRESSNTAVLWMNIIQGGHAAQHLQEIKELRRL